MLTISGISKVFSGRPLFENVSLQVNREDRIGLVGPNGAGKSTLFKLILRDDVPDTGEVSLQRGTVVGFLPQESAPAGDETVLELAMAISEEMVTLQRALKFGADGQGEGSDDYHFARTRFDELGGFQLESKAKKIMAGLGFRERDSSRLCRELSGGWVMRAHLARLLVQEPDLLMLDEPTNHLDLEALLWFQEYLKDYPGAILMISHDREFLNQLVSGIYEIRQQKLFQYKGNYDDYLVQREAAEIQQLAAYKNQQREIAHLMDFVVRFRAKNTKAAQAQSKLKQIERMEKIEAPASEEKTISFRFPQPQRSGLKVVTLENIHQAYGANVVYSGMNFVAERGQRIVLVGPNGAGKSTLLKILAGVVEIQSGVRTLGHNVKEGYFAQYRGDTLKPDRTVLEEGNDTPQRVTEQLVRTILGSFLFRGDDVFKKVKVLSGGEKSRLALVKLLLDPPNLLLMDEPTTHLDMASIDSLIGALKQYEGTLIFISHDVYFIRQIATHVIHVNAGKLTPYAGDYQYFLDKTSQVSGRAALTSAGQPPLAPLPPSAARAPQPATPPRSKEQKRLEAEQRQAKSRERKVLQERVTHLEKEIAKLEQRQTQLTADLEKPETYEKPGAAVAINRELTQVMDDIQTTTADWESAASTLTDYDRSVSPSVTR
jgi:ATP-binding cassette subfamily F protein 3